MISKWIAVADRLPTTDEANEGSGVIAAWFDDGVRNLAEPWPLPHLWASMDPPPDY